MPDGYNTWRYVVQISVLEKVQTGSEVQTAFYLIGSGQGVKLITRPISCPV